MKKFYVVVLLVVSFPFYGQIVNIPDANFKSKLLAASPSNTIAYVGSNAVAIDNNADGEIQASEALLITGLSIKNSNISSVEGLQAFTNLEGLDCNQNNLSSLDVTTLTNLSSLNCDHNILTNLTGLSATLFYVDCSYNQLTSLNINTLTNLYSIDCRNNLLQELIIPDTTHYPFIYASYNQLTAIDLSHLKKIHWLQLDHNNLTSIDFNNPNQFVSADDAHIDVSYNPLVHFDYSRLRTSIFTQADQLIITNTLLTEITLQRASFKYFYIHSNPNLVYFSVRGYQNFDDYDECFDCGIILGPNPQLQTVCVNDGPYDYLQIMINNPNAVFTTYCSFDPGGNFNTTKGNIRLDLDNNGCSESDSVASDIPIKIVRFGQDLGTAYTNINGNYTSYSNSSESTTLTPQFENPYFSVTPASFTSSFSGFGNTATANFCIAPNGVHPDLEISLFPTTPARPGFDATYKIIYKNKGTTTQSGNVTLDFQDDVTDYVTTSTTPNTIDNGLITWNFSNLAPFESREITVRMNVNSPLETPAVNVGSILILHANISSSATDENLADNDNNLEQVVVGSWDPNDKQVSVLSYAYDAPDKNYLYYTIRFQNMGTYAAENVVVADILSDKLNDDTLQMVSASHPYQSRYNKFTKKIEFIFEGINLPASINDEEASHGYVTFKIKPVSTVQQAQTVENKADIYFDFNAPVATNTTSTYFYSLLKTDGFGQDAFFTLHPNPAKNTINVNVAKAIKVLSIRIYNPLGQIIKTVSSNALSASTAIDVSSFNAGTYFMEISSDQGKTTKKFIKL